MNKTKMNWFEKSVCMAIKGHCEEKERSYLKEYTPIEFIKLGKSERGTANCANGTTVTHYAVITKSRHIMVLWDVCIFSNGECMVFFDGELCSLDSPN